jgi:deoxyribodipyrimidine photo-lyase
MKTTVFWFRRDLRLEDNTALSAALSENKNVLPIFIFDTEILSELPKDDSRLSFIHKCLSQINSKLKDFNSSLHCLHGNPLEVWKRLVANHDIDKVYFNKDYEPYARKRDAEIYEFFTSKGIELRAFKDQVIFEKKEIVKNDGLPYTVFTPYKNKWLSEFQGLPPVPKFHSENFLKSGFEMPSLEEIGFVQSKITVPDYTLKVVNDYHEKRNFPAKDATSYLSTHLRFGTVSIREIMRQVAPTSTFFSELIWREFFMQIMFNFPKVIDSNFKSKYDQIEWRNNEEEFKKWCDGETGYPMVDAGMRELNQTGLMHNRVRMITAGFLCKHLLIDWRWGEAYFASKLLDYEASSNNGNWQWSSGTGCDSAPYFRIFNPAEQLKKFDKDLSYVRKWIPEYGTDDYPEPMVEHKEARKRALDTYAKHLK